MEFLEKERSSSRLLLVELMTEGCGPCLAIRQKLTIWQKDHPHTVCLYLPIEAYREVCSQMGIYTAPTLLLFAEGKLTLRQAGCFSLKEVLSKAEQYEKMLFT